MTPNTEDKREKDYGRTVTVTGRKAIQVAVPDYALNGERWVPLFGEKPDEKGLSFAHLHELGTYRFTLVHFDKHQVEFYANQVANALNEGKPLTNDTE